MKPLWFATAVLSVAILIASLPGYLVRTPIGNIGENLVFAPTPLMMAIHHLNSIIAILSAVLSLILAGLLFAKKSEDRMGLFLSFYLLAHGILFAGPIEMLEPFWPDAARVNSFVLLPLLFIPATAALFGLFPDGHFKPRWAIWLIPGALLMFPVSQVFMRGIIPTDLSPFKWIRVGMVIALWISFLFALLYVPIYRYRRISTREQRLQTRWVIYGIFLWFSFLLFSSIPWMIVLRLPDGSVIPWWLPAAQFFWVLSTTIFPVTLTIAIMRYRLYQIDILINRTLVYGALTMGVVGVYALMVGSIGVLFQTQSNLLIALLATGLVAVLFQPLRARLQRGVNRLMYGERDEPLAVLRRLGLRLESIGMPEDILDAIVETVSQALKMPYAEISLRQGERFVRAAWKGKDTGETFPFPIQYRGQIIGYMNVALRAPGESLASLDEELLRQIAWQAGPVAYAVQLSRDLRQSRARLVTAREEERRRLRRDLHDELGPQLASQTLIIEALEKKLQKDPESAIRLLKTLKKQSRRAMQDVRQIAYNLRPPALDELGLVEALREALASYRSSGATFHLLAPDNLPPLSAAVEVAAYRIVHEAVTNVIRHANAARSVVCINYLGRDENAALHITIEDDGEGFKKKNHHGVGLNSMRERAEELGGTFTIEETPNGGTRVSARIPIYKAEE